MPKRAVFLDRDGVINIDHGYVCDPERLELLPGIREGLSRLKRAGYLLIVVTNQSGIARGFFDEQRFWCFMDAVQDALGPSAALDAIFFCPHHPEAGSAEYGMRCDCRKPEPGMLISAIAKFGIDPLASVMIGDKPSDAIAARRAGVRRSFLLGSDGCDNADAVFGDIGSCVSAILDQEAGDTAR